MNKTKLTPEAEQLRQILILGRWIFIFLAWLIIAPISLWQMRETFFLCQKYCTWAAIRYGLVFNPLAAVGLAFCIGITTSVLLKQSMYILQKDLSEKEIYFLEKKVSQIKKQGHKNFFYRCIFK